MEGKGCLFFILFLVAIFFIGKSCEKDERDVKYENGELSIVLPIFRPLDQPFTYMKAF